MNYFVCYSQAQKGKLKGEIGVFISADSILEATEKATGIVTEIVKNFSGGNSIASDVEEKVRIEKVIYAKENPPNGNTPNSTI